MTRTRFLGLIFVMAMLACTTQQAKDVTNVVVKVSDELCTEEASDPNEPDWVKLACKVEGVAGGIVHVLFPGPEWRALRARKKKA
jgi:hypothetical protein